jgi:HPt (histidine-containing phosphotransfer) domain-containing protein
MPTSHSTGIIEPAGDRSPWALPEVLGDLVSDGDLDVVLELIEAFEADTAPRIGAMRIAVSKGDREALSAQAHSARGSSRQMGAIALAETFARVEFGASDLPAAQLLDYIESAETEFASVCREMASLEGTRVNFA